MNKTKLANIQEIEIWHTYLGKWSKYFVLYETSCVGFYRCGPKSNISENKSYEYDSFEIDVLLRKKSIRMLITPKWKDDLGIISEANEWHNHECSGRDIEYIEICEISLSDPDGPKILQSKIEFLFKMFDIKDNEIEFGGDYLFDDFE